MWDYTIRFLRPGLKDWNYTCPAWRVESQCFGDEVVWRHSDACLSVGAQCRVLVGYIHCTKILSKTQYRCKSKVIGSFSKCANGHGGEDQYWILKLRFYRSRQYTSPSYFMPKRAAFSFKSHASLLCWVRSSSERRGKLQGLERPCHAYALLC